MHLLLIAYEYPPIESAQGLRWGYLARELARLGHSLDVVTADLADNHVSQFDMRGIKTRHVYAGPFVGTSRLIARRHASKGPRSPRPPADHTTASERIYRSIRRILDHLLIPDVRSEWLPWGLAAARRAVRRRRPDVVIASHEPGVDLAIARRLHLAFGLPVLADLGDPMLSSYAPRWRRGLDARFERRWLSAVDALTVTTEGTRDLLRTRLPALRDVSIEVLPQGFCRAPIAIPTEVANLFDPARLELLYTGTLYAAFRDPQPLLDALVALPHARLTVIGGLHRIQPSRLHANPQVRYLGRMPHVTVRAAQQAADVLVNIGNREDVQVPGKLFEYFGAARPLLHLAQTETDPSATLIRARRRGLAVAAHRDAVVEALRTFDRARTQANAAFDLDPATVDEFSWPQSAARLQRVLERIVAQHEQNPPLRHDPR